MTDMREADKSALLNVFNQTFDKITREGAKHSFAQDGIPETARRISCAAAWSDGASREIGTIDSLGLIRPFAKVNGKGYVETLGDHDQKAMEKLLLQTGDRVARTVPCKGEGSMYHHSFRGTFKIF